MVPHPEKPSYEDLAARVAELLAVVAEQAALIESLRAEVAALRLAARAGTPRTLRSPRASDSPAAEAKAKARAGSRRTRPGRAQGGQKGHPGRA